MENGKFSKKIKKLQQLKEGELQQFKKGIKIKKIYNFYGEKRCNIFDKKFSIRKKIKNPEQNKK